MRLKRALFGSPRDIHDSRVFHHISLIPFLAWVGLGADGLSSSAYGPEEAFKNLQSHTYLAVALAAVMGLTVFIISAAYRGIIEEFPHGGGGYVVATKLLGKAAGVTSGSALLVDYILTITVSIAAAGDAIFSFLPPGWIGLKMPMEIFFIGALTTLNLRGAKESAIALAPVFILFCVTHLALIVGGIVAHVPELPATARAVSTGFHGGLTTLGVGGMLLLFVHAYSLGGGTYTGIEAVSNGLPIMREPRVQTAKRTMVYMATSLAFTASGLLVCYLLWHIAPVEGKTMNAVLSERLTAHLPLGRVLVVVTMLSEGILLVVAAQAGFIDGPRVLANMAVDSWVPRRFAALSDRLTTHNGIVLMGATSLAALLYAKGDVGTLVVMYSINVFLTFSLSMFGMLRHTWQGRPRGEALAPQGAAVHRRFPALRDDPGHHRDGEVQGGWLDHPALHRRRHRPLLRHPRPLPPRAAQAGAALSGRQTHRRRARSGPAADHRSARADGRRPGPELRRHRDPHGAQRVPFVPLALQEPGLRLGRRDRLGRLQGGRGVEALEASTEAMLKRYMAVAAELGVPSEYRFSDRHRRGRRGREALPRRSCAASPSSPSSPARSSSSRSAGTSASCTTRRRWRSRSASTGRAPPWWCMPARVTGAG